VTEKYTIHSYDAQQPLQRHLHQFRDIQFYSMMITHNNKNRRFPIVHLNTVITFLDFSQMSNEMKRHDEQQQNICQNSRDRFRLLLNWKTFVSCSLYNKRSKTKILDLNNDQLQSLMKNRCVRKANVHLF
jgi:hypothetical protein